MQHFPKVSYVSANFRCEISLDRFSKQFAEAQQWLGDRVLEDCRAVMPHLTGSLQQRSHTEDGGKKVIFPGPYGRFQYGGKVMVDPVTGSPWARKGARKVLTDRPLQYSNPQVTDHWFDTAKARNGDYWIAGVKQRGGGG
ncbi:MAG: hypothetical protein EOM30_01425 [Clostridia bacterium]|nr:hypothetical protein [Clostridia bacterium]